MLTLEQAIKEYPEALKPYKNFLYKEYLQYKILDIIFQNQLSRKLTFLGGTALRIVHENYRFSEDLDFDHNGITAKEFDELAIVIKNGLEKEGFKVTTRNVHKKAFRCYIKFSKLLYRFGLTPHHDENILIQVDTAAHGFSYIPDIFLLNKFDVLREIRVTPIDILLSMKIYTILNRKRTIGRDFFDVVFLLSKIKPNLKYLQSKLKIKTIKDVKRQLLDYCHSLDFKELVRDVKPFIFQEGGEERVVLFKEAVKQYLK